MVAESKGAGQGGIRPGRTLLTIDDLANRWEVSTVNAWDIVRTRQVPYIGLSAKTPNLAAKGRRPVRFRLESIEAWEAREEGIWVDPGVIEPVGKPVKDGVSAKPTIRDEARKMMGY
jgi:hypothetical protein